MFAQTTLFCAWSEEIVKKRPRFEGNFLKGRVFSTVISLCCVEVRILIWIRILIALFFKVKPLVTWYFLLQFLFQGGSKNGTRFRQKILVAPLFFIMGDQANFCFESVRAILYNALLDKGCICIFWVKIVVALCFLSYKMWFRWVILCLYFLGKDCMVCFLVTNNTKWIVHNKQFCKLFFCTSCDFNARKYCGFWR